MSAADIRAELVSKLTAAATTDGKTVTVQGSLVLVVELEKETGVVIQVLPHTVARARESRADWQRVFVMRVALRRKLDGRSPSQIAGQEDEFIEISDWLGSKLEDLKFTGPYAISEISDADIAARDPYLEMGQLISILDVSVVTIL